MIIDTFLFDDHQFFSSPTLISVFFLPNHPIVFNIPNALHPFPERAETDDFVLQARVV
ncbi:uncharacterized protein ARB_05771 [Trichophyton benhamiae CBS 112371]|uniref:Uncharacterized protein n=1 Tax=Arthroderma benhamiae (strain ATCC MYA-4681 / CBS 112371) TaxID=663331 RepID=D4ANG6_ARTBC|nr:uncharacterized protein ARB_05771 [Trichophyton benhamiae CBS 112371]EFE35727.1 hypothetical protein ARB_05771 [Trichophyton benhamiae CBS 112371]